MPTTKPAIASETPGPDEAAVTAEFDAFLKATSAKHHPTGQFPTGCPPFDKDVYGPIWKDVEEGRLSK